MHGSVFGGFFGGFFQLVILLLFFVVIWWMLKNSGKFGYKTNTGDSAKEILKKRLVNGEITKKKFELLKKEIED
jgi:uncharacterized membrane protein